MYHSVFSKGVVTLVGTISTLGSSSLVQLCFIVFITELHKSSWPGNRDQAQQNHGGQRCQSFSNSQNFVHQKNFAEMADRFINRLHKVAQPLTKLVCLSKSVSSICSTAEPPLIRFPRKQSVINCSSGRMEIMTHGLLSN